MGTRPSLSISPWLRSRIVRALGASALSSAVIAACGGKLSIDGADGSVDPAPTRPSTSGGSGGNATTGVAGAGGGRGSATTGMAPIATSGSGGTTGAAGTPGNGGIAGTGGSDRVADAGGSGKRGYICFSSSQLQVMCSNGTHACFLLGRIWNPDSGSTCPDTMVEKSTCAAYDDAGGCCFLAPLPNPSCGRPPDP